MKLLQGSERHLMPRSVITGRAVPSERLQVTLRLRSPGRGVQAGARVTRAAFAEHHATSPDDIQEVASHYTSLGLSVAWASAERRSIALCGMVSQMEKAFATDLHQAEFEGGTYRARTGPVAVPDSGIVEAVLGLDNRPIARPYFRRPAGVTAHAGSGGFLPRQLAQLYNYPLDMTGAGQVIAIISLGGAYYPSDTAAACQAAGVIGTPLSVISVDHARPVPGDADGENALDAQEIATICPGAKIYLICAPNTDAGFLDAYTYAIHVLHATVISCSWGGPEAAWTPQAMHAMDSEFIVAGSLGCTITVASGDNGSGDGLPGLNMDFPASSPNVLSCGGLRTVQPVSPGPLVESVWGGIPGNGATGGGFSGVFSVPSYQAGTPAAAQGKRMGPDCAANADPQTGDVVWVRGQQGVIGGTSACAPREAARIALINQKLGRNVGFLNPTLYSIPSVAQDITVGTNGAYVAAVGPDPCTGIGRLDGGKLVAALQPTASPPVTPPPAPPPAGGATAINLVSSDFSPSGLAKILASGVKTVTVQV